LGAGTPGVPATEVARRAGHSVVVLLKMYAHCIDGQATPPTSASPAPPAAVRRGQKSKADIRSRRQASNVYLREADLLPAIDSWLLLIFRAAPARPDPERSGDERA
jgi:hypothetical protein